MTQTSTGTEGRRSAAGVAAAIVWVLITAAVAAWLFLLAFWDGVEIFSAPSADQVRSAWLMAVGSGTCLAAGPFGIWWFVRHRAWLALAAIGFAVPLVALAIYV